MIKMGMSERKWELFCAAINLFAEQSYANVSMRNIAAQLDLQAASIYNHFRSKDQILETIYNYLRSYYDHHLFDLESTLKLVETEEPSVVLMQTHISFHSEVNELMLKMILIATS